MTPHLTSVTQYLFGLQCGRRLRWLWLFNSCPGLKRASNAVSEMRVTAFLSFESCRIFPTSVGLKFCRINYVGKKSNISRLIVMFLHFSLEIRCTTSLAVLLGMLISLMSLNLSACRGTESERYTQDLYATQLKNIPPTPLACQPPSEVPTYLS